MSFPNLQNKTVLVVEDDDMSFLYLNQLFMLNKVQFDSCQVRIRGIGKISG